MNKVDVIENARLRTDIPPFRPGDQVKVHVKVREANRERIQVFEGVVLARRGGGLRETFTVRKISFGVGVERTFPLHTPSIAKIEVVRHGKVRRAKLYYLRELTGRHAKIEERRTRIPTWGAPAEAVVEPELAPEEQAAEEGAADASAEATETAEAIEPAASVEVAPAPETATGEVEGGPIEEAPAPETAEVASEAPAAREE